MDRRRAIRTATVVAVGAATGATGGSVGRGPEPGRDRYGPRLPDPADGTSRRVPRQSSELLLRGGRIVNADGRRSADVRIRGERIAEIGPDLPAGAGARVIDATGRLVIPGGIDPHAHLQGGFVDDLTTGTAAALAGGITTVGTFAYAEDGESVPDAMRRWLAQVEQSAIGDVFFHASSWPPTSDLAAAMSDLAALGQPSHKVFMTRRDFGERRADLIQVLRAAREAGVVTLMHCEDAAILDDTLRQLRAEGRTSLAHFAESRPVLAEVAATQDAVALCELTGAPTHLVHLSSARALDSARNPHTAGLPLSIETRPLYLYFTAGALEGPEGPLFVGQPPLRSERDVEAMWDGLADGRIDMLATDHAPWTRAQKLDPELDVARLRPGVSDLRFVRPVLYSQGVRTGRISDERFVEVTSTAAARTFGLYPERGVVQEESLADIVLLDPDLERTADAADDPSRSDFTPFQGWRITGWPVMTIRRGEIVYEEGRVTGRPGTGRPATRSARGT